MTHEAVRSTDEAARPTDEAVRPIAEVARDLGLEEDEVEPRGRLVAKVRLAAVERRRARRQGRLVLMTAMTPTARGEGKTTMAIGLVDGLRRAGVRAAVTLRQPTLGPVFGRKGGGTGGGQARLVPRDAIDLHLTGDSHAVQAAHNLAAAFLDNHLHHGGGLDIDPRTVHFPRVLDLSDRALRRVVVGLGGADDGPPRETSFEITSASEVMAVLALSEGLRDLRRRLGRIVVAARRGGGAVTLEDLKVAGAMAALLKDALAPNLVQTRGGSPAWVHTGAFANIAHGCSSVLADRAALGTSDLVVTEAGFGADLGAEKFFDIKCRASGLSPAAAVLVATVPTLRAHGAAAGEGPDVGAVRRGAENLAAQVGVVRALGVPCVVALNASPGDTGEEVEAALEAAQVAGAQAAVVARPFELGGAGCEDLADAVFVACAAPAAPRLLYPDELPLARKLEVLATQVYGAEGVDLARPAARRLEALERDGHGRLPVCVAKTHLSLSHDPALLGRPRGFRLPVRDVRLAAGAGFVTAIVGDIQLMPGLPARPGGEAIDLDDGGEVVGLR